MPYSKSSPISSSCCVCSLRGIPFHLGKVALKSGNFKASPQLFSLGVPNTLKILNIWSISLSPMNKGFFYAISAKMHPVDHKSTPREYCFWPSKISGHLYQSVTTSWVYVFIGRPKALARPKSANLTIVPVESINKFWGFKSRWKMRLECK